MKIYITKKFKTTKICIIIKLYKNEKRFLKLISNLLITVFKNILIGTIKIDTNIFLSKIKYLLDLI